MKGEAHDQATAAAASLSLNIHSPIMPSTLTRFPHNIPLTLSQIVHRYSLSKCSLAFTATSSSGRGEPAYLRTASHPPPPSLLHIHSINNIIRLPHLASYFYIVQYLLLYAIYRVFYTVAPTRLSFNRSQTSRHMPLDSLQALVPVLAAH